MKKLIFIYKVLKNMGLRYVGFRIIFELRKKTGLMKRDFPTNPTATHWISLGDWKKRSNTFFFDSKADLTFEKQPTQILKEKVQKNKKGILTFFSAIDFDLGRNYDWLTNPDNNYKYPLKHWTEIPDFSSETGDIKYVWEKSRFSFLYNLIRYDYHYSDDQSAFVFDEIQSWIEANPVNQGPNWRCSQEISLRVLNWIFALNYYKDSAYLTEDVFQKMMNSIYWQMRHVYSNIDFSRIAVRNNHAITETLSLYLVGMLMPHFSEAKIWKNKGKQWFEEEIAYQVYEDGTFLQFSMNYHRVVIQLFTWALYLSRKNGETFSDVVYDRAKKSLNFLQVCQDETSGQLPNYGANDGALFFPLNDSDYRDYRPQLNALHYYFNQSSYVSNQEDINWFGVKESKLVEISKQGIFSFDAGGYYVMKDAETLTFVRCGNHKDRPSQADNLHLDVWVKGQNVLRDAGSYKYNTKPEFLKYFLGTISHNTVVLDDYDQMQKGPRFVWFDWSQAVSSKLLETNEYFEFTGTIHAYKHLEPDIFHTRRIRKYKKTLFWEVEDSLKINKSYKVRQVWNTDLTLQSECDIIPQQEVSIIKKQGYYSGYYGIKEETKQLIFETKSNTLTTHIKIKSKA
jgi:hypothetical protein